jgi:hypothetical protein
VKRILLLIGMLLLAAGSRAQEESALVRLDDVLVTAQKYVQQENRTPVGMDVFSAEGK